ncbi:Cof-type HAD-IIB family hydrolase [Corynebacterium lubricantis]|uniref:Cof-type HAD-IIB family hydrolase n=1 Tax=Corynebacterium lubricantis TaxID=541095 RepID=UPI0003802CB3|nr:Cof-type HAD-IIB family hydrolase [Corynebacterium lubricantis]
MIVFLDIDGTLVDYTNHIPDSAGHAIAAARKNGHRVYVNTGRSRAEISAAIWNLDIDGMIGANGGYVESDGEVIFHNKLPLNSVSAFRSWFKQRNIVYYLEANSGLYASDGFEEGARDAVYAYTKPEDRANFTSVLDAFHGIIVGQDKDRDDVNKISYVLNTLEDFEATRDTFPGFEHGTWGGHEGKKLFGDVRPAGISKDIAIHKLLDHLGESIEHTAAFGDAIPDIPMFQVCATGVAMGNATEEVKAEADIVVADVTEDGLAEGFDRLGLL